MTGIIINNMAKPVRASQIGPARQPDPWWGCKAISMALAGPVRCLRAAPVPIGQSWVSHDCSRMREIRPSGLEGGVTDNRFSLSLSKAHGHVRSRRAFFGGNE